MSDEKAPWADAYEEFKQSYKPDPKIKKAIEKDERLATATERGAMIAAAEVNKATSELRDLIEELREVRNGLHDDRLEMLESNDRTQRWWEIKAEEMKSILGLAVAMGIEVDLGDTPDGSTPDVDTP